MDSPGKLAYGSYYEFLYKEEVSGIDSMVVIHICSQETVPR